MLDTTWIFPHSAAPCKTVHDSLSLASFSAPFRSKISITLKWPFLAAIKRGVQPSSLATWGSAPQCSKNETKSLYPFSASSYNGVHPFSDFSLISTPCFSNVGMKWKSRKPIARFRGFRFALSITVALAQLSIRANAVRSPPDSRATWSGVCPSSFVASISAFFDCKSFTIFKLSDCAATCRGISPVEFAVLMLAPRSIKRCTTSFFPNETATWSAVFSFVIHCVRFSTIIKQNRYYAFMSSHGRQVKWRIFTASLCINTRFVH